MRSTSRRSSAPRRALPSICRAASSRHQTLSLSGDKSVEYFRNIFAGKLFLATAGVAIDAGLTYPSFADLQLKEAMIHAASHVYLVADSSKINRASFTRLGALELIHAFITDDGVSDADAKQFEARGIEVLIAK